MFDVYHLAACKPHVYYLYRETWLIPSYNNTGQVRHAFLIGTTNGEIPTRQVKQEHVDIDGF
jgi:hypothetical protein